MEFYVNFGFLSAFLFVITVRSDSYALLATLDQAYNFQEPQRPTNRVTRYFSVSVGKISGCLTYAQGVNDPSNNNPHFILKLNIINVLFT